MTNWLLYSIGFLAQLLFSSRLIIQWVLSEKKQSVVTPKLFWVLSLLASILLFIYGYLRNDFPIMLGQVLTYFIYIRNLQLQKEWQKLTAFFQVIIVIFPIGMITYMLINNNFDIKYLLLNKTVTNWLLLLGIFSQVIFTFRFIYQWLYSEKKKESKLPLGFWVLSLIGAILILIYGFFRKDPVLIIAHLFGIIIYIRNITLIKTVF
ncbi:lipid-A-disaccharide synthase N-terminal domain-containing protein [uncultured Lacinutrix sp.]|uniref:lipid-A-disaccharide synthase N-terminal domain-containing protein n=1 Tax=uncultured Lacinutrix sp. TaxID=574032 RepID=UPI0026285FED|nr:lipid-A-disaccharide synthase N-terminal domain-containing protein [uncultured Lacinutrix sp.]